jgi:hypothetical protein
MSLTLKQFAALGGKARAAKLSKERRIKIAKLTQVKLRPFNVQLARNRNRMPVE